MEPTKSYTQDYLKIVDEQKKRIEDNKTNIKYLETIIDKAIEKIYDEIFELEEDTEMAIETITEAGKKYFVMRSIIEDDGYGDL